MLMVTVTVIMTSSRISFNGEQLHGWWSKPQNTVQSVNLMDEATSVFVIITVHQFFLITFALDNLTGLNLISRLGQDRACQLTI